MVIVIVEVLLVGSKSPAAISVRISTGERYYFGTAAPVSTKASSLRGRVEGLASMLKLVGLVPALFAEQLSSFFA